MLGVSDRRSSSRLPCPTMGVHYTELCSAHACQPKICDVETIEVVEIENTAVQQAENNGHRGRSTVGSVSVIVKRLPQYLRRPQRSFEAQLTSGDRRASEDQRSSTRSEATNPGPNGSASAMTVASALRILIITSEAPPVVSGISRTVAMLRNGLQEQGHSVDVISRADYPKFIRHEFRVSAMAFFWPRIRRDLAAYDVVNLHGPVPTISDLLLFMASRVPAIQRPAIVYTHHSDLAIPSFQWPCRIYNRVANRLAHRADHVVVSSTAYRAKMELAGTRPISVIPWAVQVGAVPRVRNHQQIGLEPLKVLFVGQLRPYKGLHVLLESLAGQAELALTIVGDGPMREELSERIKSPDLINVRMLGRISDAEMSNCYAENDVIVLPSLTNAEAFGLVLVEGMAFGCVPVASALPGVSEVASPSGIVVEPGDAGALRQALLSLARDRPLTRQLSEKSALRAGQMTVPFMSNSYSEVFRSSILLAHETDSARTQGRMLDRDTLCRLVSELGVASASSSVVSMRDSAPHAKTLFHTGLLIRGEAPIAKVVAGRGRSVVLPDAEAQVPSSYANFLHRNDLTSSLVIPLGRSGQHASVLSLSTTHTSGFRLTSDHVGLSLDILAEGTHPVPSRQTYFARRA